jgi:DNA-binding GntR family transcriptional regulator
MTAEPPGYVSKTDLVAALIRELIITGELGAGEQLRQRDLAQRFGGQPDPGPGGDAAAGVRGPAGL